MKAKIALGLGDNTDYEIVWNSALLEKLIRQYAIRQSELETNLDVATDINSERELVISILSFLNAGRGGERWGRGQSRRGGRGQRWRQVG